MHVNTAQTRRNRVLGTFFSAFAGVAIVAGACGSGSDEPLQPIYNTPPPGLDTFTLPTIVDPITVPLITVQGVSDVPYSIGIPENWVRGTAPNGTEQFEVKAGPYTGAFFTVECGAPTTGDPNLEYTSRNLAFRETRTLDNRGELGSTPGITELEVNGRPAAMYSDTRTVGFGVGTSGTSVFIATPECGWVIRFVQAANAADVATYPQLFGRIVSSFEPGTGTGTPE